MSRRVRVVVSFVVCVLILAVAPGAYKTAKKSIKIHRAEAQRQFSIEPLQMAFTLPKLYKRAAVYVSLSEETTLIRAPNDRLVTLTFARDPFRIVVRDYPSGTQLAAPSVPSGAAMGTAIVANGALHVFLTSPFMGYGASIIRATFDANWNLSAFTTVFTGEASYNIANLGITASPFGYVMSVETQIASRQVFFLKSLDLSSWAPTGTLVATGGYLGSPKIYWSQVQGKFFLTYLAHGSVFYTNVMRLPADLSSFAVFAGNSINPAGTVLLYPDGGGESLNTSDLTLAEIDGATYGIYFDGDQQSTSNLKTMLYRGTIEQLWQEFWPLSSVPPPDPPPPPPPPSSINVIAQMTGPSTGGVTISASDTYLPTSFPPWKAADRDLTSFYHCNNQIGFPHWWRVDLPSSKTIRRYEITPRAGIPNQAPKNFTLEGFNGASWVVVDARSNVGGYISGQAMSFTVTTPGAYGSYRLNVATNVEGSLNLSLGEVAMFE